MNRISLTYKIIAVLTALCLECTSILIPTARAELISPIVPSIKKLNPENLKLPVKFGEVVESHSGNGNVIIIQDAHAIPDAQKNIANVIKYVQKEFGVETIALEGASGDLDPQIFRSFPDKKLLRQVMKGYMDAGEIAGGTAAAVFDETPTKYQGVEDWDVYEEGLGLYLSAMDQEEAISKKLNAERLTLNATKEKIYSKALLEVDQKVEKFYENAEQLTDLIKVLGAIQAPRVGSELEALWKEVNKSQQPTANSTQTKDIEVRQLASQVEKVLKTPGAVKAFNMRKQEWMTGSISPEAFALHLKEWADQSGLNLEMSSDLHVMVRDQQTLKSLEGTKLFRDLEVYIREVKDMMFTHTTSEVSTSDVEEGRGLDRRTQELRTLTKLSKLELSREEWKEFKSNSLQPTKARSDKKALSSQLSALGLSQSDIVFHLAFYLNAEERDEIFFKNVTTSSTSDVNRRHIGGGSGTTIIVAGGFHAEGLTSRLKEAGMGYALVMPKINHIPENNSYRAQMRGEVSWKDYFEVENGRIHLYKAFVRATRDRLLRGDSSGVAAGLSRGGAAGEMNIQMLKAWRDQIIRDLSDQGKVQRAAWYTRYMDEAVDQTIDSRLQTADSLMMKVDNFIRGLRGLEKANQLTSDQIAALLKANMMQSASVGGALAAEISIPEHMPTEPGRAAEIVGGQLSSAVGGTVVKPSTVEEPADRALEILEINDMPFAPSEKLSQHEGSRKFIDQLKQFFDEGQYSKAQELIDDEIQTHINWDTENPEKIIAPLTEYFKSIFNEMNREDVDIFLQYDFSSWFGGQVSKYDGNKVFDVRTALQQAAKEVESIPGFFLLVHILDTKSEFHFVSEHKNANDEQREILRINDELREFNLGHRNTPPLNLTKFLTSIIKGGESIAQISERLNLPDAILIQAFSAAMAVHIYKLIGLDGDENLRNVLREAGRGRRVEGKAPIADSTFLFSSHFLENIGAAELSVVIAHELGHNILNWFFSINGNFTNEYTGFLDAFHELYADLVSIAFLRSMDLPERYYDDALNDSNLREGVDEATINPLEGHSLARRVAKVLRKQEAWKKRDLLKTLKSIHGLIETSSFDYAREIHHKMRAPANADAKKGSLGASINLPNQIEVFLASGRTLENLNQQEREGVLIGWFGGEAVNRSEARDALTDGEVSRIWEVVTNHLDLNHWGKPDLEGLSKAGSIVHAKDENPAIGGVKVGDVLFVHPGTFQADGVIIVIWKIDGGEVHYEQLPPLEFDDKGKITLDTIEPIKGKKGNLDSSTNSLIGFVGGFKFSPDPKTWDIQASGAELAAMEEALLKEGASSLTQAMPAGVSMPSETMLERSIQPLMDSISIAQKALETTDLAEFERLLGMLGGLEGSENIKEKLEKELPEDVSSQPLAIEKFEELDALVVQVTASGKALERAKLLNAILNNNEIRKEIADDKSDERMPEEIDWNSVYVESAERTEAGVVAVIVIPVNKDGVESEIKMQLTFSAEEMSSLLSQKQVADPEGVGKLRSSWMFHYVLSSANIKEYIDRKVKYYKVAGNVNLLEGETEDHNALVSKQIELEAKAAFGQMESAWEAARLANEPAAFNRAVINFNFAVKSAVGNKISEKFTVEQSNALNDFVIKINEKGREAFPRVKAETALSLDEAVKLAQSAGEETASLNIANSLAPMAPVQVAPSEATAPISISTPDTGTFEFARTSLNASAYISDKDLATAFGNAVNKLAASGANLWDGKDVKELDFESIKAVQDGTRINFTITAKVASGAEEQFVISLANDGVESDVNKVAQELALETLKSELAKLDSGEAASITIRRATLGSVGYKAGNDTFTFNGVTYNVEINGVNYSLSKASASAAQPKQVAELSVTPFKAPLVPNWLKRAAMWFVSGIFLLMPSSALAPTALTPVVPATVATVASTATVAGTASTGVAVPAAVASVKVAVSTGWAGMMGVASTLGSNLFAYASWAGTAIKGKTVSAVAWIFAKPLLLVSAIGVVVAGMVLWASKRDLKKNAQKWNDERKAVEKKYAWQIAFWVGAVVFGAALFFAGVVPLAVGLSLTSIVGASIFAISGVMGVIVGYRYDEAVKATRPRVKMTADQFNLLSEKEKKKFRPVVSKSRAEAQGGRVQRSESRFVKAVRAALVSVNALLISINTAMKKLLGFLDVTGFRNEQTIDDGGTAGTKRSEMRKIDDLSETDQAGAISRGSAGDNIPLSDEEFRRGLKTLALFAYSEKVEAYKYSEDGKYLFVSYEGRLAIYDIERNGFLQMDSAPMLLSDDRHTNPLNVLAVSGNRQRFAFLTRSQYTDMENGEEAREERGNISVVDVQTGSVQVIDFNLGFNEKMGGKDGIQLSEQGTVLSIKNDGITRFDHYYLSPEGATDAQPARFSSNYEDSDSVYATDYVIATKRGGRLISLKRSADQLDLMPFVKEHVDLDGDITMSPSGRFLEGKVSGGSKAVNSLYRWTADPKRKGENFPRFIHWMLNLLSPNFFKRRVLDLENLSKGEVDFRYFQTLGKAESVVLADDGWIMVHYLDGTKSAVLPSAGKKISIKKGSEVLAFLDSKNEVYKVSTNLVRGSTGEETKPVAAPHGNDAQLSGQPDQYIVIREGYRTLGLIEKATGKKTSVEMNIPKHKKKKDIDFDTLKQHGKYLSMRTLDDQFIYVVDGETGKVVYVEESIMRVRISDVVLHRSPYTNHLVVQTVSSTGGTSVIDLDSHKVVNRIPTALDIEFNEDFTEYGFDTYSSSRGASVSIILHNVHFLEGGEEMVVYTNIAYPGQTQGPKRFVNGPYPMKVAVVSKNEKPESRADDLDFFYPEEVEEIGVFTRAETAQRNGSYIGVSPWKKVSKLITPFRSPETLSRARVKLSPSGKMAVVESVPESSGISRSRPSVVVHDLVDAREDSVLEGVSKDLSELPADKTEKEFAALYRGRILNSFSMDSLSSLDEDGRNLLADQFSRAFKDLFERPNRGSGEVEAFIDRIVATAAALGEDGESFLHQIADGMRKAFYLGNEKHEDYKYARDPFRMMDYMELKTNQAGQEVWADRHIGQSVDVPDLERGTSGLERIKDTLADFSIEMLQHPRSRQQESGAKLKGVVEAVERTLFHLPNTTTQMTPEVRARALLRHIFFHYKKFLIHDSKNILEMSGREVRDVRIMAPEQRSPRIDFLETYLQIVGFDEMVAELSPRFPELQLFSTGWDLFDSLLRLEGVQQLYDEMAYVETLEPEMQTKYLEKKKADTIFAHHTMKILASENEHFDQSYMRRVSSSMSVIGRRETLSLIRLAQSIARPDEAPELLDQLLLSTADVDKLLTQLLESSNVNAKLFALQLISAFMEVNQDGSYKLYFSPDVLNIAAEQLRKLTPTGIRQLIHKNNQGLAARDQWNPTEDDISQLHRSYSNIMEKVVDSLAGIEPKEEDRIAFIKFTASGFSAGQVAREKIADYLFKIAKGEDLNLGPYFQKYIFEKKDVRLLAMMLLNDSVKERLMRMGNALSSASGDGLSEREFSAQEAAFVDFIAEVAEGVINTSADGRDLDATLDKFAEALEQAAPQIKELFSKLSSQDLPENQRPKVEALVDLVMLEFQKIVDAPDKMKNIRKNLSHTEFALTAPTMAVAIGTEGWTEKAYEEAVKIFLAANHWTNDDLAEPVNNAGKLFGYSVIFKYMDSRSPTSRHTSIIGFEKVIALGLAIKDSQSGDSAKNFKNFTNDIVLTATQGNAENRYTDFIAAVEVFSFDWRTTYKDEIEDAFEGTAAEDQTADVNMKNIFDNPGMEFKTKGNFLATAKFIRSLANKDLMALIRKFRRDKSDPRNAKVADAIATLVNTGVDIDPKALEQFVLDPYEFFGRKASHVHEKIQNTLSTQNLFFKPDVSESNGRVNGHFGVSHIDLTAEDFVKGSLSGQLDDLMAMHPDMENEGLPVYTLFDSGLFFKMLQSPMFAPDWQAEVFGYKHDRGNGAEESIFDMASLVAYVNFRRSKGELGDIQDVGEITEDNVLEFLVKNIAGNWAVLNIREMLSTQPGRPIVKLKAGYEEFYKSLTGPGIGMPPMPVLLAFRERAITTMLGIDKKQADGDTNLNAEELKFVEFKNGLEVKSAKPGQHSSKTFGQAVLGEKFTVRILSKSNPESLITNNRCSSCARFGDGKSGIYYGHVTNAELVLVKEVPGAPGSDFREETLATSVVTLGIPTGQTTNEVLNKLKADIDDGRTPNVAKALAGGDFENHSGAYTQVTLDNIEGNRNFLGKLEQELRMSDGFTWNDFLQTGFKYYFANYLLQHPHSRGGPGSRRGPPLRSVLNIGKANSDFTIGERGGQKDSGDTTPFTLLSYTDAKGQLDTIAMGIGPRDVLEPEKGVFKLDARDTWHVANLEAQVYGDSSLFQGIVEIQNALLASTYNEKIKGARRANLSQGFFDEKGQLLGYMIAYAGWDQEKQREIIYVMDMAVHPDHRKTTVASRLMKSFLDAIKTNGLTDMPIIAELVDGETGSYRHVKKLVENSEKNVEKRKREQGSAFDPTRTFGYKFAKDTAGSGGRRLVELQPLGTVVSRPLPVNGSALNSEFYQVNSANIVALYPQLDKIAPKAGLAPQSLRDLIKSGANLQLHVRNGQLSGFVLGGPVELFKGLEGVRKPLETDGKETFFISRSFEEGRGTDIQLQLLTNLIDSLPGDFERVAGYVSDDLAQLARDVAEADDSLTITDTDEATTVHFSAPVDQFKSLFPAKQTEPVTKRSEARESAAATNRSEARDVLSELGFSQEQIKEYKRLLLGDEAPADPRVLEANVREFSEFKEDAAPVMRKKPDGKLFFGSIRRGFVNRLTGEVIRLTSLSSGELPSIADFSEQEHDKYHVIELGYDFNEGVLVVFQIKKNDNGAYSSNNVPPATILDIVYISGVLGKSLEAAEKQLSDKSGITEQIGRAEVRGETEDLATRQHSEARTIAKVDTGVRSAPEKTLSNEAQAASRGLKRYEGNDRLEAVRERAIKIIADSKVADLITYHNFHHWNDLFDFVDAYLEEHPELEGSKIADLLREAIYRHDEGYYGEPRADRDQVKWLSGGHEFAASDAAKKDHPDLEGDIIAFLIDHTEPIFSGDIPTPAGKTAIDTLLDMEVRVDKDIQAYLSDKSRIELSELSKKFLKDNFPHLDLKNNNELRLVSQAFLCARLIGLADVYGHSKNNAPLAAALQPEFSLEKHPALAPTPLEQVAMGYDIFSDSSANGFFYKKRLKFLLEPAGVVNKLEIPVRIQSARDQNFKEVKEKVVIPLENIKKGIDVDASRATLHEYVDGLHWVSENGGAENFDPEMIKRMHADIDGYVEIATQVSTWAGKIMGGEVLEADVTVGLEQKKMSIAEFVGTFLLNQIKVKRYKATQNLITQGADDKTLFILSDIDGKVDVLVLDNGAVMKLISAFPALGEKLKEIANARANSNEARKRRLERNEAPKGPSDTPRTQTAVLVSAQQAEPREMTAKQLAQAESVLTRVVDFFKKPSDYSSEKIKELANEVEKIVTNKGSRLSLIEALLRDIANDVATIEQNKEVKPELSKESDDSVWQVTIGRALLNLKNEGVTIALDREITPAVVENLRAKISPELAALIGVIQLPKGSKDSKLREVFSDAGIITVNLDLESADVAAVDDATKKIYDKLNIPKIGLIHNNALTDAPTVSGRTLAYQLLIGALLAANPDLTIGVNSKNPIKVRQKAIDQLNLMLFQVGESPTTVLIIDEDGTLKVDQTALETFINTLFAAQKLTAASA